MPAPSDIAHLRAAVRGGISLEYRATAALEMRVDVAAMHWRVISIEREERELEQKRAVSVVRYFELKNETHVESLQIMVEDRTTSPQLANFGAEPDAEIHKVREADGRRLTTLCAIKWGRGYALLQKGLASQRSKAVSDAT